MNANEKPEKYGPGDVCEICGETDCAEQCLINTGAPSRARKLAEAEERRDRQHSAGASLKLKEEAMDYEVACLPCHGVPIDKCPCADKGKVCPHPLWHSDYARKAVKEHRVTIAMMPYLGTLIKRAREQVRTANDRKEP